MTRLIIAIILALTAVFRANAQELNCTVEVNADQVQNANKDVFKTLQDAISEYLNTTQFTSAQFSPNERIECRMFFTIKEYTDGNTFSGDLQLQASRPVYNSSYTTNLINFKDTKVTFTYEEGQPLIFTTNTMESNLTAILNFWAYFIIAVDFDSFSLEGGSQWFDQAQQVVQMAQSSGETGWKAFEDTKNRSSVLSSYTDPATSGIRKLIYEYHRRGLDEMATSPDKGRAAITKSLEYLLKIKDVAPMTVSLSMFKDSKLDELVNIYTKGTSDERQSAYDILEPLYPAEQERLRFIKEGKNK